MTIPALTQKQMLSILTTNGYNTISSEYWDLEGVERILISNGVNCFPLKLKKFYFFPEVIKRCEMLGIGINQIPEDIRDEYETCFAAYGREKINWFLHNENEEPDSQNVDKDETDSNKEKK